MRNRKVVSAICVLLAILMVLTVVISVIATSAYAVSQSEIDALQAQQDALAAERAGMQENIDALESQKADVLEQKAALDEKNELARQEIELIDEQINLYTELIAQKAVELDDAEAAETEQYNLYCEHIRAMEENGNYTYLALIFSSKSLSQLLTNIDMISEIMNSDQRLYEQYTAARENTETVKADYEATLTELGDKQDELASQKADLEKEIASAVDVINGLESDIDAYMAAYDENEAAEAALQSQMDSMAAELAAQEAAARAAASSSNTTYTGTGSVATGSYMWPCPSCNIVTSQYGYRIHPISGVNKFHSGVDIGASYGSAIVAADSGTVTVAEYSNSYGNYVMIYHSSGNYTLYAHMSSIAVSVNQTVTKGDTIGYVGSTGYSTGPHLHFEIRINGSTVDPLGYFTGYVIY